MSTVIKTQNQAGGVTFWRQDYVDRVPRFEVFRCVGFQPDSGVYFFQSLKEKTIIGRSFYQLGVNGFHPFCLGGK